MADQGFTVWFTGLSGAGKTTLSKMLQETLMKRGIPRIEIMDGDEVRQNLSKGLGFSKEDRDTNILRIAYVCKLLTRNNAVVFAAAISPYREIRAQARQMIGNFVEVFCHASIEALAERDVKGLYKKALAGEIKNFTGVSDPYEEPENPEVIIHSDSETPEKSLARIVAKLEELGYIQPEGDGYSEEEEEKIRNRLEDLGYL